MKRQTFIPCLLPVLLTGALPAQVVGYWRFDEQAPGNSASTNTGAMLDASGNANSGAVSRAGVPYVTGSPDYGNTSALEFYAAAPAHVAIPDPSGVFNFSPAQSVTLEALVRTYNIGQDGIGAIMNKQGASPGEWWWRINANGRQQFWVDDGQGERRNVSGAKPLNDHQWHHVAAVYDAARQQLRVYVDYVLDGSSSAVFSTSGTIGNAQDLWIAAFQNGTRQFDGDIDFVRFSLGALDPTNFVQPDTFITGFTPANGASFVSPAAAASFAVESPTVGVAETNIIVAVNGSDVTSQLSFSGNDNDRTVTLPPLTANEFYRVNISATDKSGHAVSREWIFNTFAESDFSIEGEDYNFDGGQFIDNPQLSSSDGPDNYLDRLGVEGIDYHQTNTPALTQYRIGDQVGTAVSSDALRQAYLDAQQTDPGVTDYDERDNINGEWLNYTRTFPAGTYRVFARFAKPGSVPVVMRLDEVTRGSTTSSQTTAPIGFFRHAPTASSADYQFAALTDALGREVAVPLSGVRTLRLTMVSGTAGLNLNYLIFVPASAAQAAFVAAVSPAAGAGNVASNATIAASLRNADTAVVTNTIQLQLDGSPLAAAVTGTDIGADVSGAPPAMSLGWHTATLIFADSSANAVTNQWSFYVANQAVRGWWKFDEKTAGHFADTNAGAILDASGNARHGTVNGAMAYVAGSFNYGNTPALRFTTGPDRVTVPDAAGNFTFTNSFTFEAVVRTTNVTTTTGAILAKNGTGDGEGEFWWRLPGLAGGVQRIALGDGTKEYFIAGTNALNDGRWHHVAMVYDADAAQIRLYADYNLETVATNILLTNAIGRPSDLAIGSFLGGGSDFDGDMDFVRISDGALTPAQFVPPSVALQPIVKTQRPAPGARNVSPWSPIEVEFQNRDTAVVLSSLKLFIDGTEVTATSTKSVTSTNTEQISFVPASPLADGPHVATAVFDDTAVPANSWTNSWSFTNLATLPVLGFWQFNEQAPGNLADATPGAILDSSGQGHHGTAVSVSGIPYIAGATNYGNTAALAFTVANTNEIDVPDPNGAFNWNPTQSVTLEAVLRTTNIGQAGVGSILAKQLAATPEWWWRINANGRQQFNVNDSSGAKSVTGATVLNDGQWHHLAVIYDGQTKQLRAYVDYAQDGTTVATTFTSTTSTIGNAEDLYIGRFQAGNRIFEGDMDMVRITGAALDPSWFLPVGGVATPVTLVNAGADGGNGSFRFATEAGRAYVIQATPDLNVPWVNVQTNSGDGTVQLFNFPLTGTNMFFRVQVR